jgi:hypothetical protein
MSRVINPDSAGKERSRLTKCVVLAVRELAKKQDVDDEARDLAAFITLALSHIARSIDVSVIAWEKRGYWVKADKFRMEWVWAEQLGVKMERAVIAEEWMTVAQTATQVANKLNKITIPQGHRLGRPWDGAWQKLHEK